MLNINKAVINEELYNKGSRWDRLHMDDRDIEEHQHEEAEAAWIDDHYDYSDPSIAYYLIVEEYGIETGNQFLLEIGYYTNEYGRDVA